MNRKTLGLDIRHHAVSYVLLNKGSKSVQIEAYDIVSLSEQKESKDTLAGAVKKIVEKIDATGCTCVASFPANQALFRNIRVPFTNKKKIIQILPYELEPTLPFAVEDMAIDFHTITISENAGHTDLIAAGIKKVILEEYIDTLASFRIEPEIITIGGYYPTLCLAKSAHTPENWLFADIEVDKATLFAVASNRISLIRSFPVPANTSSAIKSIGINIQRTTDAFSELFNTDFMPEEIRATGPGCIQLNFEKQLSDLLNVPVHRIELFREIDSGIENYAASSFNFAKLDNALALALNEDKGNDRLNFHKDSFVVNEFLARHKTSLVKTGALAGVVLALALLNFILNFYFINNKISHLNHQITDIFKTTFPEVTKIVDPLQQMKVKINEAKKSTFFPSETTKYIRSIDVLNEISKRIPDKLDVDFTRLVISPENVMVSGITDTFNSADEIKSRLEESKLFQKVIITSTSKEKSGTRIRFKLKVVL
ncbi:MAG: pilus assembly protein PilM [Thermodesulfobacteriota bacterium]|nr:pilus assembly protein PilM [Thermodesulfobacteriota bacterium]